MDTLTRWRQRARQLQGDVVVLSRALRDPRVPWYARVVALAVVAYALSPIDLIPDPVPILGHLDDLVLVPLGIALAIRLLPSEILAEYRERADGLAAAPATRISALAIVAVWVAIIAGAALIAARLLWG